MPFSSRTKCWPANPTCRFLNEVAPSWGQINYISNQYCEHTARDSLRLTLRWNWAATSENVPSGQNQISELRNMPTQIYWKFQHQKKNGNFQIKNSDIFHISVQNIDWGGSNENPLCMFLSKNKKNSVYPFKPQFYYINVGFKGSKLNRHDFVILRILTGYILSCHRCKGSSCGQRKFLSDCADAQANLRLRSAHMAEGTFSDVAAQLVYTDDAVIIPLQEFEERLKILLDSWRTDTASCRRNYLCF